MITDPQPDGSIPLTLLGIVVAFIVGVAVIRWFLDYLKSHTLFAFVLYRVVLGSAVILIWILRR